MTRELVVNMESVSRLSREMVLVTRNIAQIVDRLEEQASALRGQWTGEASEAYTIAQRSWTDEIAQMRLVLERLAEVVQATSNKHTARETRNAQVWG